MGKRYRPYLDITSYRHTVLTSTHLWYARGRSLRRRDLKTNVDEHVHRFPTGIWEIKANDVQCVVAIPNANGHRNLCIGPLWNPLAENIQSWVITPTSVACQYTRGGIYAHDSTNIDFIPIGNQINARDYRALYRNNRTIMSFIEFLDSENDDHRARNHRARNYTLVEQKRAKWIECKSRTSARLAHFFSTAVATQLTSHAQF